MRLFYHELDSQLEVFSKQNTTLPPHLHKYLECIYVTQGQFRLEIGGVWTDLKPHDMAVIFPDVIHQFQVEEREPSQAVYVLGVPDLMGPFGDVLRKYELRSPVIPGEKLHPDILHGLNALLDSKGSPYCFELRQAYVQVLLARALPVCQLAEKGRAEPLNLTRQIVSYISEHFMEPVSLTGMARHLGVSPYVLSRTFSGVLHMNFNQYLNEIRLDHAAHLLRTASGSITDIFLDSGFRSQATFNRVFQEKFRQSPREYRRQNQERTEPPEREAPQNGSPWKLARGRFL